MAHPQTERLLLPLLLLVGLSAMASCGSGDIEGGVSTRERESPGPPESTGEAGADTAPGDLPADVTAYAVAAFAAWAAGDAEALGYYTSDEAAATIEAFDADTSPYDWEHVGCSELESYWICWFDSGTGEALALRIDGARVAEGMRDAIFEAEFG